MSPLAHMLHAHPGGVASSRLICQNLDVRLATWNCNGAFHRKMSVAMSLNPDILIVPECGDTATAQPELGISHPTGFEWVGGIPNKGLGVFSFGDYRISRAGFYNPEHRFVLPLEVSGPIPFFLLAIWTTHDATRSYVRPVMDAWNEYAPQIEGRDVVIAGDFNGNVIFPSNRHYHFSNLLDLFAKRGVRSLYHEITCDVHGAESAPTFFMYRKQERPYHIDYVFAGDGMRSRLQSFEVGKYADWSIHSDHMPLTAIFGGPIPA